MMMRILKGFLELGHLSMYKQWIYTKKTVIFFEKNDGIILKCGDVITENLSKHTKIQLSNGGRGIKHTDCLRKFFKAVIYRCKGVAIS